MIIYSWEASAVHFLQVTTRAQIKESKEEILMLTAIKMDGVLDPRFQVCFFQDLISACCYLASTFCFFLFFFLDGQLALVDLYYCFLTG